MLMAWTPLGRQVSMQTARSVDAQSIGVSRTVQGAASTRRPGSAAVYSRERSAANASAACRATASSDTTTWADASTAMALSFPPPAAVTRRSSVRSAMAWSNRPSSTQALARPLWISVPECPPASPRTVTSSAAPP